MNKIKNGKKGEATVVVEAKRCEEAFKRQAVEHCLRSGRNGTQDREGTRDELPRVSRIGSVAAEGKPRRGGRIWKWKTARCVPSWRGCAKSVTF